MKYAIMELAAAGLLVSGAAAFAQDAQPDASSDPPASTTTSPYPADSQTNGQTNSDHTMSKHQMMKACMQRQAAKNDGSTKMQMRKACKEELKNGQTPGTEGNQSSSSSRMNGAESDSPPR